MAKLRGVKFGKPSTAISDNFDEVKMYRSKEITSSQTVELLGLTWGTVYRKLNFFR